MCGSAFVSTFLRALEPRPFRFMAQIRRTTHRAHRILLKDQPIHQHVLPPAASLRSRMALHTTRASSLLQGKRPPAALPRARLSFLAIVRSLAQAAAEF